MLIAIAAFVAWLAISPKAKRLPHKPKIELHGGSPPIAKIDRLPVKPRTSGDLERTSSTSAPASRVVLPVLSGLSISIQSDFTEPLPSIPNRTWFGSGTTLDVAGFKLSDAHVYASQCGGYDSLGTKEPSEIVLLERVRLARGELGELGYWPSYGGLHPEQRYAYLRWLADGRVSLPPADGFLFLFYYGLERRVLVDAQNKQWVLREIIRLRKLDAPRLGTKEGNSFRKYTTNLLWFEIAKSPELFDLKSFARVCELTDLWTDFRIVPPLAWLAKRGVPLPAFLARQLARLNPDAVQSVVTKRLGAEFTELFEKRYHEQFGDGIKLERAAHLIPYSYRPASSGLTIFSCQVADPLKNTKQYAPLTVIWNSCVDDLRRLSKLTSVTETSFTPEAWEAMPAELRKGVDHPFAEQIRVATAAARLDDNSDGASVPLVEVSTIALILGISKRPKLTVGQSRRIAEVIGHAGYSVEPDSRFHLRPYRWDESIAVFLAADAPALDLIRYVGATCILRLGLTVAEADGVITSGELERLSDQIDSVFQLPPHEKQRLDALRAVLAKTGADLNSVASRLAAALPTVARERVGRLLVAIAAVSDTIGKEEKRALRKCFRALGLPPELLEQTMTELSPTDSEAMVTVQTAGDPGVGERIPQPADLRLNRDAINAILAETRDVSMLLAEAMATAEPETEEDEVPTRVLRGHADRIDKSDMSPPRSASADQVDMPPHYSEFLSAIASNPRWARADAEILARKHNLMLAGAVEAINDWSLDRLGVLMIEEDGDALTIDQSVL